MWTLLQKWILYNLNATKMEIKQFRIWCTHWLKYSKNVTLDQETSVFCTIIWSNVLIKQREFRNKACFQGLVPFVVGVNEGNTFRLYHNVKPHKKLGWEPCIKVIIYSQWIQYETLCSHHIHLRERCLSENKPNSSIIPSYQSFLGEEEAHS